MSEVYVREIRLNRYQAEMEATARTHGRAIGRVMSGGGSTGNEFIDNLALVGSLLPGDKIQNEIIVNSVNLWAAREAAKIELGRILRRLGNEFERREWEPLTDEQNRSIDDAINESFRQGVRDILDDE